MSDINNNGKVEEEFDEETETDQLDNTADLREKLIEIELEDKIEDRDPEIEDFAEKFRKVYEKQFREYLEKLKKNDSIYATSLPTKKYNKETFDEDSMNSINLLFYFDSLDMDENGNINAVVTTTFDRSESCHFQPYLCKEYGPYYKTTLFTCLYNTGRKNNPEALNFFLDLPIDLYNLIED